MKELILVGIGGFVGSIARYGVRELARYAWPSHTMPYATFFVNILGCYLVGVIATREDLSDDLKLFLVVGILGGFTTFSSFGFECIQLHKTQGSLYALLYALLSVSIGVSAVIVGLGNGIQK